MATGDDLPDIYTDGTADYIHGLPEEVITVIETLGMALTSFKPEREPEFMSEAEGPRGLMAAIARSKEKITVNASGFIIDKEDFEGAKHFEFEDRLFIMGKKGAEYMHKGFAKCDFTCTSWPNVTTPPSSGGGGG